jgi:hypothetical protein
LDSASSVTAVRRSGSRSPCDATSTIRSATKSVDLSGEVLEHVRSPLCFRQVEASGEMHFARAAD